MVCCVWVRAGAVALAGVLSVGMGGVFGVGVVVL